MISVKFLALAFLTLFVMLVMVLDSLDYLDQFWKAIRKWRMRK
jgi:uncharacterized protein YoxC